MENKIVFEFQQKFNVFFMFKALEPFVFRTASLHRNFVWIAAESLIPFTPLNLIENESWET